ncbi:hypothetical protein WA026_010263 [Henosepilachna vigintioctopunctata]|uniref:Uncharacterized protein n=1 Tax=Henosepilachna vigintioctopunctata TaxID=420089 RepID=A0AAW1UH15_9CUCU
MQMKKAHSADFSSGIVSLIAANRGRQRKQLLKQTTDNFISQNTPPPIEDEIKPIVNEAITHVINEDRRAKEAKRRSEWQRKSRNMEIKKMKAIVIELKT